MTRAAHALAAASLVALIFVCLAWELWGAPLRPGGSWLVLKTLPLLAPLMGVLGGRRYTFKWGMMLALPYFIEGATRAYAERPPSSMYALAETALAALFFASTVVYLRRTGRATASAEISRGSGR
jgi:uncharacterized membrane protein